MTNATAIIKYRFFSICGLFFIKRGDIVTDDIVVIFAKTTDFTMIKKQLHSIKDLAELSGFSLSSVSRALDPSRAHLVKPESRKRILDIARHHNFSINQSARRLRSAHTEIISALTYAPGDLRTKFFGYEFNSLNRRELATVESRVAEYNYALKLHMIDQDFMPDSGFIDRKRTDGVIFISYHGTEYLEKLRQTGIPYIYASNFIDRERQEIPFVTRDLNPGYREAIEYFISAGMQKFAYAAPVADKYPQLSPPSRRTQIIALFDEYKLKHPDILTLQDYYSIRKLAADWTPELFEVLFCANDVIAEWFVREFRYLGIKVPEQIKIVGYDNDTLYHDGENGIASIGLPPGEMFRGAVDLLMNMVKNGKCDNSCRKIYNTKFFLRESCL